MTFAAGAEPAWADDAADGATADVFRRADLGHGVSRVVPIHAAISRRAPRQQPSLAQRGTRLFDVVFALSLLFVALPALVLVAILLQIDSPGRLFFVQRRIGKGGVAFNCLKFRTMCEDADAVLARHLAADPQAKAEWEADFKLRDDPRITRLGTIVRKFSIDEFPQLINILRGDMAVVGPRPIVPAEIERYRRSYVDYCAVKPGLTGMWQVSGRNDTSYNRRVALDRFYVRNKSLWFDLRIVAMTVPAVLGARGSY